MLHMSHLISSGVKRVFNYLALDSGITFSDKTARQEQLFLAVSVVQLSPEAKLKSDKGLQGPERKETTHLLYSTQSSPHKLNFKNQMRKHVMEYLRMRQCSEH